MNCRGGRKQNPLPPDPERAAKILQNRLRSARQRAALNAGVHNSTIYPQLAKQVWRIE